MSTMVQFNKFYIGELVHNHDTNEDGKIVGFRDTVEIPEYEVIVPIEANNSEPGSSLKLWPETALERAPLSSAADTGRYS
jgi:hypothetical protein